MCCPFSVPKARVENIQILQNNENKIHFIGYINSSPQSLIDSLLRFFRRLELAESYAEICDGTFDLFGKLFQNHVNQSVSESLHQLHESAHTIEEMLHAVCFFSDLTRIVSGKFIEYQDKKKSQIDYIRSIARILLASSNFTATLSFGNKLLCGSHSHFGGLQTALSLSGYTMLSISTIWRRFYSSKNHHFVSDLCIYSTGMAYEIGTTFKGITIFKPWISIIKKVKSLAHAIHGYAKRNRLMPPDRVKIKGEICY